MRRIIVFLASIGAAWSATLPAQERMPTPAPIPVASDGPIRPVSTRHSTQGPDGHIDYTGSFWEVPLKGTDGVDQATISATAYVREGVGDRAARPVVVLFNGGPGASSSPLHFSAFGPKRLGARGSATAGSLADNPGTLLDVADLIFVDPVGTGFSRPLREGGGKPYWTPEGDAASVLTLVRGWLRDQGRSASPLFFAGESYGGYRIGVLAKQVADLNVRGLILISPALDFATAADQAAINALPTMAIAAWHHGKVAREGRTAEAVWEAARQFAQGDYAVALQQGVLLPDAERQRIAARISALIGLPAATIAAADLRVPTQAFLEALVPGRIVGRLDVRVTAPKPVPGSGPDRPAAANDPALGLGRSNVIVSLPIGAYLRGPLGVASTRDYYSLTLDVNFNWDWRPPAPGPGESWSVVPNIARLMEQKPALRLLVVGGYYDLTVPLLGTRYALSRGGIPLSRLRILPLAGGHSAFEEDVANAVPVRDFIRSASR